MRGERLNTGCSLIETPKSYVPDDSNSTKIIAHRVARLPLLTLHLPGSYNIRIRTGLYQKERGSLWLTGLP
jgi:hypothetical protein